MDVALRRRRPPRAQQTGIGALGGLDGRIDRGDQHGGHHDQDRHDGVGGGVVDFRHLHPAEGRQHRQDLHRALRDQVAAHAAQHRIDQRFGEEQAGDVGGGQAQRAEGVDFLFAVGHGPQHGAEDHQRAQQDREEQVPRPAGLHHRAQHMAVHAVLARRHHRRAVHHPGVLPGDALGVRRVPGIEMDHADLAAGPRAVLVGHHHHRIRRQVRPVHLLRQQVVRRPGALGAGFLHLGVVDRNDAGVVHVHQCREPRGVDQRAHFQRDALDDHAVARLHAQQLRHGLGHEHAFADGVGIVDSQQVAKVFAVAQFERIDAEDALEGDRIGAIGQPDDEIRILRKFGADPVAHRRIGDSAPARLDQFDEIGIHGAPGGRVVEHAGVARRRGREQPHDAALRVKRREHQDRERQQHDRDGRQRRPQRPAAHGRDAHAHRRHHGVEARDVRHVDRVGHPLHRLQLRLELLHDDENHQRRQHDDREAQEDDDRRLRHRERRMREVEDHERDEKEHHEPDHLLVDDARPDQQALEGEGERNAQRQQNQHRRHQVVHDRAAGLVHRLGGQQGRRRQRLGVERAVVFIRRRDQVLGPPVQFLDRAVEDVLGPQQGQARFVEPPQVARALEGRQDAQPVARDREALAQRLAHVPAGGIVPGGGRPAVVQPDGRLFAEDLGLRNLVLDEERHRAVHRPDVAALGGIPAEIGVADGVEDRGGIRPEARRHQVEARPRVEHVDARAQGVGRAHVGHFHHGAAFVEARGERRRLRTAVLLGQAAEGVGAVLVAHAQQEGIKGGKLVVGPVDAVPRRFDVHHHHRAGHRQIGNRTAAMAPHRHRALRRVVAEARRDVGIIRGNHPAQGEPALVGHRLVGAGGGLQVAQLRLLVAHGGHDAADLADVALDGVQVEAVEGVGGRAFARQGFVHGAQHDVVDAVAPGDFAAVDQAVGRPQQARLGQGGIHAGQFEEFRRPPGLRQPVVGAQEALLNPAVEPGVILVAVADLGIAADQDAPALRAVAQQQGNVEGDPALGQQAVEFRRAVQHALFGDQFVLAQGDFLPHGGQHPVQQIPEFGVDGPVAAQGAAQVVPSVEFGLEGIHLGLHRRHGLLVDHLRLRAEGVDLLAQIHQLAAQLQGHVAGLVADAFAQPPAAGLFEMGQRIGRRDDLLDLAEEIRFLGPGRGAGLQGGLAVAIVRLQRPIELHHAFMRPRLVVEKRQHDMAFRAVGLENLRQPQQARAVGRGARARCQARELPERVEVRAHHDHFLQPQFEHRIRARQERDHVAPRRALPGDLGVDRGGAAQRQLPARAVVVEPGQIGVGPQIVMMEGIPVFAADKDHGPRAQPERLQPLHPGVVVHHHDPVADRHAVELLVGPVADIHQLAGEAFRRRHRRQDGVGTPRHQRNRPAAGRQLAAAHLRLQRRELLHHDGFNADFTQPLFNMVGGRGVFLRAAEPVRGPQQRLGIGPEIGERGSDSQHHEQEGRGGGFGQTFAPPPRKGVGPADSSRVRPPTALRRGRQRSALLGGARGQQPVPPPRGLGGGSSPPHSLVPWETKVGRESEARKQHGLQPIQCGRPPLPLRRGARCARCRRRGSTSAGRRCSSCGDRAWRRSS